MNFDDILGHEEIKTRLTLMAKNNEVSHAYIFCGKNGIGKTSVARAFAEILTGGSNADIIEVTNERYNIKKAAALSVETIRLARSEMFVKPYASDKKVFIIPDADTMSVAAQNAMLKVFEEPPKFCIIILIAENQNNLLETVRSRAISVRFSPLSDDLIRQHLERNSNVPSDLIIKLADGSIEKAQTLLNDEYVSKTVADFCNLAKKLDNPGYSDIYNLIAFLEKEKAYIHTLLNVLTIMFRQTLLKNEKEYGTMFFKAVDFRVAAMCLDIIEKSRTALKNNANYSMVVSELMLSIMEEIS